MQKTIVVLSILLLAGCATTGSNNPHAICENRGGLGFPDFQSTNEIFACGNGSKWEKVTNGYKYKGNLVNGK